MAASQSSKVLKKLKSFCIVTAGASVFFAGINIVKGNEKFYNDFVMPVVRRLDPELSHEIALLACKYKIFHMKKLDGGNLLETTFFGHKLLNPIGIAAGFDKQGEAIQGLNNIGFGFVEIGSVTPMPQFGNPKPRVFRLNDDKAIINRYGFNSDGHSKIHERILELKEDRNYNGILGVNLGKNKTSDDSTGDYVKGVELFGPLADYLVINVSSPNTPGLRKLQGKKNLETLLAGVITARNNLKENNKVPVFLKLAPDLDEDDIKDICTVIAQDKYKIDGLIISNTTVDKSNIQMIEFKNEEGGLSGAPLKSRSTQLIAKIYQKTDGKIPIIGVGGIFTGQDAYEKIQAGASYLQLYTAFIYHGPPIVNKIKRELNELLKKDGLNNVSEAVGMNYRKFL